jgi:hypothetical protein
MESNLLLSVGHVLPLIVKTRVGILELHARVQFVLLLDEDSVHVGRASAGDTVVDQWLNTSPLLDIVLEQPAASVVGFLNLGRGVLLNKGFVRLGIFDVFLGSNIGVFLFLLAISLCQKT